MSGKKIKTSSIISIIVSVLILGILGSAQDIFSVEHTGVDNGGSEMEEEDSLFLIWVAEHEFRKY